MNEVGRCKPHCDPTHGKRVGRNIVCGDCGRVVYTNVFREGGNQVDWHTTAPNPSSPATGHDAGQRGWVLHAVVQEAFLADTKRIKKDPLRLKSDVPRTRALCGLRPAHGWGMDLFIEARCSRCEDRLAKMNACWTCHGQGTQLSYTTNAEGEVISGSRQPVPCKTCKGTGFRSQKPSPQPKS